MGIYARRPVRLVGQVAADLFMIAWTVLCWLAGRALQQAVDAIATPARETAAAARSLADHVSAAAEQAARVPGVGDDLRRPFDRTTESLGELIAAADQQVSSIESFGALLGWLVFLLPVAILMVIWLPARVRFYRRARAAQRFLDSQADLDLFALRAMATAPMHLLGPVSDDPVGAWRGGDRTVINALAALELRRSGMRLPATLGAATPPPVGTG